MSLKVVIYEVEAVEQWQDFPPEAGEVAEDRVGEVEEE